MSNVELKIYKKGCNGENQFIFVGRLDKTKGINILLTAWKLLSSTCENIPKLIICGTGPEEKWCHDFIQYYSLSSKVKLMGFVENSKAIELIAESLALILPTQWYEGFPMTIVEAYAHGTPVLGSNIGNVGSLLIDGVTGYTFDPDSPDAIKCAVHKILGALHSRFDFYRNTFEYYHAHYTAEKNYNILSKIYEIVMVK